MTISHFLLSLKIPNIPFPNWDIKAVIKTLENLQPLYQPTSEGLYPYILSYLQFLLLSLLPPKSSPSFCTLDSKMYFSLFLKHSTFVPASQPWCQILPYGEISFFQITILFPAHLVHRHNLTTHFIFCCPHKSKPHVHQLAWHLPLTLSSYKVAFHSLILIIHTVHHPTLESKLSDDKSYLFCFVFYSLIYIASF